MLKKLSDQQTEAVLKAVQGSELIAEATGESVSEVLRCHLVRKPPGSETRVVELRRAGGAA